MRWTIELTKRADKQLARIGAADQRPIIEFIDARLSRLDDPRSLGRALRGNQLGAFWRFRVGDYRLICDIFDDRLTILVIE